MTDYRSLLLSLFFAIYGFMIVFWRAKTFRKKTGLNAILFNSPSTPIGFLELNAKLWIGFFGLTLLIHAIQPEIYNHFFPVFSFFDHLFFQVSGWFLLFFSLVFILYAQSQMGKSWRIGVQLDGQTTSLVTEGIYRYSRNPIYLGVWVTVLGFFLVFPNFCQLLALAVTTMVLGLQIRFEEQFMQKTHGNAFTEYCKRVRRFI